MVQSFRNDVFETGDNPCQQRGVVGILNPAVLVDARQLHRLFRLHADHIQGAFTPIVEGAQLQGHGVAGIVRPQKCQRTGVARLPTPVHADPVGRLSFFSQVPLRPGGGEVGKIDAVGKDLVIQFQDETILQIGLRRVLHALEFSRGQLLHPVGTRKVALVIFIGQMCAVLRVERPAFDLDNRIPSGFLHIHDALDLQHVMCMEWQDEKGG